MVERIVQNCIRKLADLLSLTVFLLQKKCSTDLFLSILNSNMDWHSLYPIFFSLFHIVSHSFHTNIHTKSFIFHFFLQKLNSIRWSRVKCTYLKSEKFYFSKSNTHIFFCSPSLHLRLHIIFWSDLNNFSAISFFLWLECIEYFSVFSLVVATSWKEINCNV